MKVLFTVLSAAAFMSTLAYAEVVIGAQAQGEPQSRFKQMSTDELLEKRGTITSRQERNQLHSELVERQKEMTKEQKEKFNNRPQNRVPKRMNQNQGGGMGGNAGGGMGGNAGGGMGNGMGGGMGNGGK